jgi:hypothetical protein
LLIVGQIDHRAGTRVTVVRELIFPATRAQQLNRALLQWLVLNKGTYFFALNDDGSCCLAIFVDTQTAFNAIFAVDSTDPLTTIMGAAAAAGDITTKDVSILLFNNVFLFDFGPNDAPLVPGFHNFDFQEPNKLYAMAFVSWVTPGLLLPPFDFVQDITGLSHELAEILNDPFGPATIHNITPWWLTQIEVGPQCADLPWFKRESPSSALHNAYSYPDETVLTQLSPLEGANCQ